ncbi:hypothetical protein V5738_10905 [Salinisphaera sp. SPP-AMP-43]|uniref:Acb2/Tad1 domain-containing protein n=1 Tax=Salinisphaera sp. SPP-AMP-43 TaxID=3121288 RepID=UPI003C6E2D93
MQLHVGPSEHRAGFVSLTVQSERGVKCERLIPGNAHGVRDLITTHGNRLAEHYGVVRLLVSDDLPISEATAAAKIEVPSHKSASSAPDLDTEAFAIRPFFPFKESVEFAESQKKRDTMRREHRELTQQQAAEIADIKALAESIDTRLSAYEGERFAMARARLEEAVMWATKAITSSRGMT